MAAELSWRWVRVGSHLWRQSADAAISISGISTCLPSWLLNRPCITLTDTEDAKLSNAIAFPFSTHIVTPEFYLGDLRGRHIRYRGLHELANCRGKGVCATCRMLVVGGTAANCAPMKPLEKWRLKLSYVYIGFEDEMRLSCQTQVNGDIQVITVPALNLYGMK